MSESFLKLRVLFLFLVVLFLISPLMTLADQTLDKDLTQEQENKKQSSQQSKFIGDPLGIGNKPDPTEVVAIVIGRILSYIVGLIGVMTLVIFMYGGLMYLTAQGNQTKTEEARKIILWATLGLIIIFSSYGILSKVFTIIDVVLKKI